MFGKNKFIKKAASVFDIYAYPAQIKVKTI